MTETDIKNSILIELSKPEHGKAFNRPTGMFYPMGKIIKKDGKRYLDITNVVPVTINQTGHSDIQGHTNLGIAYYIECKTPDKIITGRSKEQINFIKQMQSSGALGGFASSAEEALEIIFGGK